MSKFAEQLRRTYLGSAAPIGFRKSAEKGIPPLLIIADLTKANLAEAKAIAGTEIDAVVVGSDGVGVKSFGQLVQAFGDIPLGLFLESADKEEIAKFVELGSDFVVFDLKTPLEVVNKEGLGKIIKIEPSLDQGLVRTINALPLQVDGVLVAGEESLITVERLLICQRFAELLDKPLLVTLGSSIVGGDIESLCEAGVNGLVLPQGLPVEELADLKKMVATLSRAVKRKAKSVALLPRLGGELEAEVGEDEEEEI